MQPLYDNVQHIRMFSEFTCWLRAFYATLNLQDFTFMFLCGCNKIFKADKLFKMVKSNNPTATLHNNSELPWAIIGVQVDSL